MKVEEKVLDQTQFQTVLKEAEIYFKQGLYEEAKKSYVQLLELLNEMPSSKELIPQKDFLEKRIKEIDRVLKEYDFPLKVEKKRSVEEVHQEAIALKELGLYKEAIEEFHKIIKQLCREGEKEILSACIDELIECYKEENQTLDCIEFLETISSKVELDEHSSDVLYYKLGILYEDVGGYKKSLSYFKKIKNKKEFPDLEKQIKFVESRIKKITKFDYLLKQKLVSNEDLKKASLIAKKSNKSIEYVLLTKFNISKEDIGRSLSLYYQCNFYSFSSAAEVPKDLIKDIKREFLETNVWVPLKKEKDKIIVLIDDPYDIIRTDIIKKFFKNIELCVAIKEDILQYIDYFWTNINKSSDAVRDLLLEYKEDSVVEEELPPPEEELILSDSKIVKFVNDMILDAWNKNASDIHIEPCPITHKTDIRFRIDGICQHYVTIPNRFTREIVSRIKIMSNLDITEKRLPQDGKIKFMKDGKLLLELRVATLPTVGGLEDVVLRLLHTGTPLRLEDLGMPQGVLKEFKKVIKKPYGLILVVGPTGSGKTTTLHSVLGYINTPEIKIWTAEDPVEITQRGLRQIEVNPKIGLTFARVMRAFLRADPDVIMVGEMRDQETAVTAVDASLTGHLVFSTLHTNTASETVTRLLEMGLDPHNFADSLLAVLAQRLVRKLCNNCKQAYHPSKEEFEEIVDEFGREIFEDRTGIKYISDLVFYRPKGCEECGNTGYKGRIGIYELLLNNDAIKKLIKKKAPTEDIKRLAVSSGMITLKQDGILKVFQGITDMKEVRRVCME